MKKNILLLFLLLVTIALPTKAQEDLTSKDFDLFQQNMRSKNYEKTMQDLKEWEARTPDDPELHCAYSFYYLIPVLDSISESSDLKDFFTDNDNMLPDTFALFQNLQIRNYFSVKASENVMQQYHQAIHWLQKGIEKNPDVIGLYDNLIEAYNNKLEFKYSTALALKLIERAKVNKGRWLNYQLQAFTDEAFLYTMHTEINSLLNRNEYSLAEILADSLISFDPQNMTYQIFKANILSGSYRKKQAFEIYENLFATDSTNIFLLANMANFYCANNESAKAVNIASRITNCGVEEIESLAKEILEKYASTIMVDGQEVDRSRMLKATELLNKLPLDTLAVESLLQKWETEAPYDIELCNVYAYYYRRLAESQGFRLQLEMKKKKSSETSAYMNDYYQKALKWIQKGLAINADRLDLLITKWEIAVNLKDMDLLYQTTLEINERDSINGHKWQRMYNALVPSPSNEEYASKVLEEAIKILKENKRKAQVKKLTELLPKEK